MIYREEQRDLFTVGDDYYLAHCISADFKLGAGIAVQFDKRFDCKKQLKELYKPTDQYGDDIKVFTSEPGYVLPTGKVFNMVTKNCYWEKPTYATMRMALEDLHRWCKLDGVDKLAMPRIGCGLDRLAWEKVRRMIQYIFADTDVEILVCYQ